MFSKDHRIFWNLQEQLFICLERGDSPVRFAYRTVSEGFAFMFFFSVIFQISGGISILSGIIVLGVYLCGGKKTKKEKELRRTKGSSKPQELDRAHYG